MPIQSTGSSNLYGVCSLQFGPLTWLTDYTTLDFFYHLIPRFLLSSASLLSSPLQVKLVLLTQYSLVSSPTHPVLERIVQVPNCSFILHCTALHCTALHCTLLDYIKLIYTTPHSTTQDYSHKEGSNQISLVYF